MTNNTIAIINKVQKFDSRMKIEFVDGEVQITATLYTEAPLPDLLYGDLNKWIQLEKTLLDEPEEYFQKKLRYANEDRIYFKELFDLLKGILMDDSDPNVTIFNVEDFVKVIIKG